MTGIAFGEFHSDRRYDLFNRQVLRNGVFRHLVQNAWFKNVSHRSTRKFCAEEVPLLAPVWRDWAPRGRSTNIPNDSISGCLRPTQVWEATPSRWICRRTTAVRFRLISQ